MLCVVINAKTYIEVNQQIREAIYYADLIELRLDILETLNFDSLKQLRMRFQIPMIFTLRSSSQCGKYSKNEEDRLSDICRLFELHPEYVDIEYDVSLNFIEKLRKQKSQTKIILSHHNFEGTPTDSSLEALYQEMNRYQADYYKMAVTANSCLDAFRFMCWAKDKKLIAISMGFDGQVSRILSPIMSVPITYASLEEGLKTAPGQLPAEILAKRYQHHKLNSETEVYGLIGDPVDKSISDVYHNAFFQNSNLNAVYVKIQCRPSDLETFLYYAKQFPFKGLSVTMPLKEDVMQFLDWVDPEAKAIGAVNTLLFKEGNIHGFNTDGKGALNAIELKTLVINKHLVIIGAGGSAKAIAFEAIKRGARVTIVNRNEMRAKQVAKQLKCETKSMESLERKKVDYDILINCTPVELPISPEAILDHKIVMDIKTRPIETLLLLESKKRNCQIVFGYEMFQEQAKGQYKVWNLL